MAANLARTPSLGGGFACAVECERDLREDREVGVQPHALRLPTHGEPADRAALERALA
jgi:hypothetical protein